MAHGNGIGRPYFFKGPAGAGAGVAGVQAPRFQAGLPHGALPGLLNAREAAQHRQLADTEVDQPDERRDANGTEEG